MELERPKYDYPLSAEESKRIQCTACEKPATYGQNEGRPPFWYHCDHHAASMRKHGSVWAAATNLSLGLE